MTELSEGDTRLLYFAVQAALGCTPAAAEAITVKLAPTVAAIRGATTPADYAGCPYARTCEAYPVTRACQGCPAQQASAHRRATP